jgi:hypothetical protein
MAQRKATLHQTDGDQAYLKATHLRLNALRYRLSYECRSLTAGPSAERAGLERCRRKVLEKYRQYSDAGHLCRCCRLRSSSTDFEGCRNMHGFLLRFESPAQFVITARAPAPRAMEEKSWAKSSKVRIPLPR